jgi:hypothetical protein
MLWQVNRGGMAVSIGLISAISRAVFIAFTLYSGKILDIPRGFRHKIARCDKDL